MSEELITKETAQSLIKIKGEIRGVCLKTDWEFVLKKKGKEGLEIMEKKLAELGCPIKYKDIKATAFYPIGLDVVSVLVIKEMFDFHEKEIEQFGAFVVNFSLFLKIFMKYFGSISLLAKQGVNMWREHFTVGDLEISEFSEEKKYIVVRLKNFQIHPVYCTIFKGYFSKIVQMTINKPTICQETKCSFRGDQYHEFLVTW